MYLKYIICSSWHIFILIIRDIDVHWIDSIFLWTLAKNGCHTLRILPKSDTPFRDSAISGYLPSWNHTPPLPPVVTFEQSLNGCDNNMNYGPSIILNILASIQNTHFFRIVLPKSEQFHILGFHILGSQTRVYMYMTEWSWCKLCLVMFLDVPYHCDINTQTVQPQ